MVSDRGQRVQGLGEVSTQPPLYLGRHPLERRRAYDSLSGGQVEDRLLAHLAGAVYVPPFHLQSVYVQSCTRTASASRLVVAGRFSRASGFCVYTAVLFRARISSAWNDGADLLSGVRSRTLRATTGLNT